MAQNILSHLHKILPQEQSWKMQILRDWHTIMGPLSQKVLLQRVDDHAIILAVAHPGLAQELLMLSDLIRSKINDAIGHEAITTIHFRTMAQRKAVAPLNSPVKKEVSPIEKIKLSTAEEKQLSTITNKELRNALAEFYATCKERTRT